MGTTERGFFYSCANLLGSSGPFFRFDSESKIKIARKREDVRSMGSITCYYIQQFGAGIRICNKTIFKK
jgi:hypothetical protein